MRDNNQTEERNPHRERWPTDPVLTFAAGLEPLSDKYSRIRSRWIVSPGPDVWSGYAISEWELLQAGFTDHHPHDENAFVLAGELHVEVNGREMVARAGDNIRVPAGKTGKYWAPTFARMLGIYGPNPDGAPSQYSSTGKSMTDE